MASEFADVRSARPRAAEAASTRACWCALPELRGAARPHIAVAVKQQHRHVNRGKHWLEINVQQFRHHPPGRRASRADRRDLLLNQPGRRTWRAQGGHEFPGKPPGWALEVTEDLTDPPPHFGRW